MKIFIKHNSSSDKNQSSYFLHIQLEIFFVINIIEQQYLINLIILLHYLFIKLENNTEIL